MVKTIDSNTARDHWRDVLDEAAAGSTWIVITRYGRPAVAVIAYDDFLAWKDQIARRSPNQAASGPRRRRVARVQEHAFFNSAPDGAPSVEDVMNDLRGLRHRAV